MRYIYTILITLLSLNSFAQLCGTELTPQAKAYMDSTEHIIQQISNLSGRSINQVPVVFYDVRTSSGTGGLTVSQMNSIISDMNSFYVNANMEFYQCGGPFAINSSTYYNFTATSGNESGIRSLGYTSNVINIYLFNDLQSSSGGALNGYTYFPPSNSKCIYMRKSASLNGTTMSHEMGHFFRLYHTHGTTNTGLTNELVNGSNCSSAGDRVCDTEADPNLYYGGTLHVNSFCQYTGNFTDANGQQFNPNTHNIMSYSLGSCRNMFTTGQYNRIYNSYVNDYNFSCANMPTTGSICDNPTTVSCGQTLTSQTNSGGTNSISTYSSCGTQNESGKEKVYKVVTSQSGSLSATLSNYSADVDVHILDGCNASDCLARGDVSASVSNAPAGTYYIVVDGYNGAQGTFNIAINCQGGTTTTGSICDNATTINCGQSYTSQTNSGGSSLIDYYSCASGTNESGPEKVYQITTSQTGDITATVSNVTADVDVQILDGCTASDCLARNNSSATATNVPAGTYYIVVDGYNGAIGSFDLYVDCQQGTPPPTSTICDNATAISCGQTLTSQTNSGGSTLIDYYSCASNTNESGPEKVYQITTGQTGDITATVSNVTADVDVQILDGCSSSDCLARHNSSATATNVPAGTYYIVIDGYNGAIGSFDLFVDCQQGTPPPTCSTTVINCGETNSVSYGSSGFNSSSTCSNSSIINYEIFEVTITDTSDLLLTIPNRPSDAFVDFVNSCTDFTTCVGNNLSPDSTILSSAPPGTYYIMASSDGFFNPSNFDFSLECIDPNVNNNQNLCSIQTPISCGQTLNGTTIGGQNTTSNYSCSSNLMDGNEYVYKFTASGGENITATLSNSTHPDLNVFILSDCDPNSCVSYGDYTASMANLTAGIYYIVVDGKNGYNGAFILSLTCNSVPQHTINTNSTPQVGGTVNGGGTYPTGNNVTLTAIPNQCWSFTQWLENGVPIPAPAGTNSIYSFTATQNTTITAQFNIQTISINLSANPSGISTQSGTGMYNCGDSISISTTLIDPSYSFVNWTNNGTPISTSPSFVTTFTSGANLVANYTASAGLIEDGNKDFYIFPNPTDGIVQIGSYNRFISSIRILSFEGKLIKYINTNNSKDLKVDLSDLTNGVYYIILGDSLNNSIVKRLIKQ